LDVYERFHIYKANKQKKYYEWTACRSK
jgi:hypothetical protein